MNNHIIVTSLKKLYLKRYISQTSSATAALISLLLILKKEHKHKNEVIIPSVVCPSILFAVNFLSLKPVFVDMETKYFNMNLAHVKKLINKKTLSIVCVHCYGISAEIIKISKIAKKRKIFLIEDACLNFGGKLNSKFYGSFGDAAIVSFGYDKIISEKGGAVIIKKKKTYLKIKKCLLSNPIFLKIDLNKKKFTKKIDSLSKNILNRTSNAEFLYNNIKSKSFIKPKFRKSDVYWRYPILCKINRKKLISDAIKRGIIITTHYPNLGKFQHNTNLKNAEFFDNSVINIFVKNKNSNKYLKKVCNFLNSR
jgi:dTDP-4-amino-4,6-dideoxygalactose transaminase